MLLALLAARVDAAPSPAAPSATRAGDGDVDGDASEGADASFEGVLAIGDDGAASAHEPPDALLDPTTAAAIARSAPSVRSAVAAAYRVAGLAEDPSPSFAHRSRLAALVPWIGLRVGQDDTWSDVVDPTIGHLLVYDVRATWHFDRLVFDPNEVRASAMGIARRRDRRRLAMLVSRTYFTWLRARTAAEHAPAWSLRAAQAAADLDALTDGAWAPAKP